MGCGWRSGEAGRGWVRRTAIVTEPRVYWCHERSYAAAGSMPKVEKLSVSLPPHRAEYLRKKSAETGIPISHLIEGALAELERLEVLDELLEGLHDVPHDEPFAARLRKNVST
jgi:hypothetical protein